MVSLITVDKCCKLIDNFLNKRPFKIIRIFSKSSRKKDDELRIKLIHEIKDELQLDGLLNTDWMESRDYAGI